jgi:hypothetical protein
MKFDLTHFVPFVFLWLELRPAAGFVFWPLLVVVARRALILPVICNNFHRFLRRPLVLIPSLGKRSNRECPQHRYNQQFSE